MEDQVTWKLAIPKVTGGRSLSIETRESSIAKQVKLLKLLVMEMVKTSLSNIIQGTLTTRNSISDTLTTPKSIENTQRERLTRSLDSRLVFLSLSTLG